MSKKSNKKYVICAVVLTFLAMVANAVSMVVMIVSKDVAQNITLVNWLGIIANTVAFIFALIYLLLGYGKEDAILFKIFVSTFLFALVIAVVSSLYMAPLPTILKVIMVSCFVIMIALVSIITFCKNLGKKLSMSLTGINMILPVILIILALILSVTYFTSGDTTGKVIAVSYIRMFILSFVLFVATRSKYIDKEERYGLLK